MPRTDFKGISERAKKLINAEEGTDIDFKRGISGLSSEDLVAFANSDGGGAILIGVNEKQLNDGRRIGEIVGCPVGDEEKQKIYAKAQSCSPLVEIQVFTENTGGKPFFRIEVPSGKRKPYATSNGTYKIRGDGLNNSLLPQGLLAMFLMAENEAFVTRFRQAAHELEKTVTQMRTEVVESFKSIKGNVQDLEWFVEEKFDSVHGAVEDAYQQAEASTSEIGQLQYDIEQQFENQSHDLNLLAESVDRILRHLGLDDTATHNSRPFVREIVKDVLSIHPQFTVDEAVTEIRKHQGRLSKRVETLIREEFLQAKQEVIDEQSSSESQGRKKKRSRA